jgi:DNA polymerase-3 subunit gamma/tau
LLAHIALLFFFYFRSVMAEYIVSARKYRPTRFRDMVGQEHISATLQNAIKSGQLAHSFLFCGPRGVGKTTAARILAKTINCENITPDIEACNECPSCVSFNHNSSFNIHELDAASNNSVEDIRQLVEQVRFPPQSGKYKIYIIDEVHMLSPGAFNAFLKTLEEPPPYCKFILATTEKHKILPTILSRCQIFDFRRISIDTIVAHLRHICELEHIVAEEDALHIIAQKCDGGMRDALSMFDRLSSFAEGRLTYDSVLKNLNVLDYDYFFKVTDALLTEELTALMTYLSEVLKRGFEGDDFILGLCEHFRNLLFAKNTDTLKLMEVSDTLKKRYLDQTNLASNSFLISCLAIGNQCDVNYKQSKNKRLSVELALIKMCYVNATIEASTEASKKKLSATVEPVQAAKPGIEKQDRPTQTDAASTRPVAAQPKPVADKDAVIKKSSRLLSLDDIDNGVHRQPGPDKNKDDAPLTLSATIREFNQENVTELWQAFSASIRDTRGGVSSLMDSFLPVVTEATLSISVDSELQKTQFLQVAMGLKNFLYSHIGFHPDIQIEVVKAADTGPKYYTPQDKLKRLIELNPSLRRFQKELGLDLDYD